MVPTASPHYPVRPSWLALTDEAVLAPEQAILDAHHHLWDRPEGTYTSTEFEQDWSCGHDVRASLYVQCTTGYRETGPTELKPVGEVETILAWSREHPHHPLGLVAAADLRLGDAVSPVLDAMAEAGQGKVCGIRNATAFHPDPVVRSNPNPAPAGLLTDPAFQRGVQALASRHWCLDVWAYHTQLPEVVALARRAPEVRVVVNHLGGPLGVGPYDRTDPLLFRQWQAGIGQLAELPNTCIKLGGMGLRVMGHTYAHAHKPPHSSQLADDWRPHVECCIQAFGPQRAMFESNFPVDKGQFSYRAVWNAFKRLAAGYSQDERDDLFWRSAVRCYRLKAHPFSSPAGDMT